ncbi:hypothetical protein CCO03_13835 [Comamonas serinivorans]|uniref:BON domain-containing protein n=1 Tax=Comamonas serinivorans TaxID=1082851 RepID=A0A1Y0EQN8_9BURK|nr:hypothetical protein CCO03_13835 [Comamonas serinivorans]
MPQSPAAPAFRPHSKMPQEIAMPTPPTAPARPARLGQSLTALGLAVGLLALSACSKPEEPTPGQQLDQAIQQTQDAASQAADALRDLAGDAARAASDAARAANEAAASAGAAIETTRQDTASASGKAGDALKQAQQDALAAATALRQSASQAATAVSQAASEAAAAVGDALTDSAISARIRADFARDSELSSIDIGVETHDGVVTLRGTVPTAAAKTRADNLAKTAKGVKSVNNVLNVQ